MDELETILLEMSPLVNLLKAKPEIIQANLEGFDPASFQTQILSLISECQLKKSIRPEDAEIVN